MDFGISVIQTDRHSRIQKILNYAKNRPRNLPLKQYFPISNLKKKNNKNFLYFQLIVPPVNFVELYSQVVTSPAKRAFLLTLLTFVGIIFIFGIFCGRVTRRSQALKNK